MEDLPVVETSQGVIVGKYLSVKGELSDKLCANFNNVPFAKATRFQRPESYGKWKGTWDGTGKYWGIRCSNSFPLFLMCRLVVFFMFVAD